MIVPTLTGLTFGGGSSSLVHAVKVRTRASATTAPKGRGRVKGMAPAQYGEPPGTYTECDVVAADARASRRARCGTTVSCGSAAEALPASKTPNRVPADPTSSAAPPADGRWPTAAAERRPPRIPAADSTRAARMQAPAGPRPVVRPDDRRRAVVPAPRWRRARRPPRRTASRAAGPFSRTGAASMPEPARGGERRCRRTRTAARGTPRARRGPRCRRAAPRCRWHTGRPRTAAPQPGGPAERRGDAGDRRRRRRRRRARRTARGSRSRRSSARSA